MWVLPIGKVTSQLSGRNFEMPGGACGGKVRCLLLPRCSGVPCCAAAVLGRSWCCLPSELSSGTVLAALLGNDQTGRFYCGAEV